MYLSISLLSSNLDETPSKIVPREFADKEGFSFLSSERQQQLVQAKLV